MGNVCCCFSNHNNNNFIKPPPPPPPAPPAVAQGGSTNTSSVNMGSRLPYTGVDSSLRALAGKAEGFGHAAIGGLHGPLYHVTTLNDDGPGSLRDGCRKQGPLWIVFQLSGTIELRSHLKVSSFKTIDGRGQHIKIKGKGFRLQECQHVIICNLEFEGGRGADVDAIQIKPECKHVWIDRCSLSDFDDGLIDITRQSTDITISRCHFSNHNKTILIGSDPSHTDDRGIRVTIHHCFFDGTKQRHPRVRFGKVHLYNNYTRNWGIYAVCASVESQIYSQCNIYEGGEKKVAFKYLVEKAGDSKKESCGCIKSEGDLFVSDTKSGLSVEAGDSKKDMFNPSDFYPSCTVEAASDALKHFIQHNTGWQSIPLPAEEQQECLRPYCGVDASLRALAGKAEGFGRAAIGGLHGPLYHVTTLNDDGPGSLRDGCRKQGPLWIVFQLSGTIELRSHLKVSSFKTVDGRGQHIKIKGKGFRLQECQHVIICNLEFEEGRGADVDAIQIKPESKHVWIDRCSLSDFDDGLIDITRQSTDITVSRCHFSNHNKTILIGSDPSHTDDRSIRVTIHHCFFDGTKQRHPRVRYAKVHLYNNYTRNWGIYAVCASVESQIYSQCNIYEGGEKKVAFKYLVETAGDSKKESCGCIKSEGDLFVSETKSGLTVEAGESESEKDMFNPSDYYPSWTVEVANDSLKHFIQHNTGWQSIPLPTEEEHQQEERRMSEAY